MQNVHDKGNSKKKDGIVYTEDGVPVYTLYLGNIPRRITENDIKKYFSGFGEVKTVNVITKHRKSPHENPFQYGFVTFAKPEYAAKALNIRSHVRLARHLKVKPADTWKQPKIAHESIQSSASGENDQTDNSNDDTPENADQMSILELNDDCLCHIFSFLSQNEVLKLPFVCQRFFNIIEHRIKVSKFFDFNGMHENFTLMETRQILASFGDHIKRLRLGRANDKYRRYIEFISLYCRHLEEIDFTSFRDIHFDTYKRIFLSARQLKSVTLNDCDLTDSVCSLLNALTELESLDVSNNHEITGKSLKNLKSLKQLNLSNCENIESRYFVDMCKGGMKLKELNIVGCYQLADKALEALISTQSELERLAHSNSYRAYRLEIIEKLTSLKHVKIYREGAAFFNSEVLCELSTPRQEALESLELYNLHVSCVDVNRDRILLLKNLKKLCIVRDRSLDDKYLEQIANSCKQLEYVNISGSLDNVAQDGILALVENLPNLKYLNISHSADGLDMSLPEEIFNILLKKRKNLPLTLCVEDTGLDCEEWERAEYSEIRKLIRFSSKESLEPYDDDMDLNDDSFSDVLDYFGDEYDTSDDELYDSDDFFDYQDAIFWL